VTHREARRKLGSRTVRRANTNGKNIPGKSTTKGRALKRRYPRPASRKNAVKVARLVTGLSVDTKKKASF
jgi:hypothetical protein